MGEKDIVVPFFERGDWVEHELPREFAKSAVRDMIKQMADEPIDWLLKGLTLYQIQELVGAARVEMRERERAPNHLPETDEGLKLLGDA